MMDEQTSQRWMHRAFALTFAVSALAKLLLVRVILSLIR